MDASVLRALITVRDQASGPLRGIRQAFDRAGQAASAMRRGFGPVGSAFGNAGRAALGLGRQVAGMLGPLGAIGGAASLAGIGAMVQSFVSAGDEIAKAADRIGVGVEELQQLRWAAELAGVPAETLDRSLQGLNRRIGETASGQNQNLVALFRRMGISVRDANGSIRSAADLMPQLAAAFQRNENPVVRTRMAVALFGEEAGPRLVNLLAQGEEGLAAAMEEARKYGLVSDRGARSAEAFGDAQARMSRAVMGVRNSIAESLLPVLQPLLERLTEWVAANREVIAANVSAAVTRVADALAGIDWAAVIEGVRGFASGIGRAVELVGGWQNALLGLVAFMNAPLIAAVGTVVKSLAVLAGALLFNPVGLFLSVLAGAAYLVWQNWDRITAAFERARETISRIWDEGIIQVDPQLAEGFRQLRDDIVGAWDRVGAFFDGLWADVREAFDAAWAAIGPIVERVAGAVQTVVGGVRAGRDAAGGVLSAAGDAVGGAASAVGGAAASARDAVAGWWSGGRRESPVRAATAAGQAGPMRADVSGEVTTRVIIEGAPPGTRVATASTGVAAPDVEVGTRTVGAF